ncbi:FG-GAP-like repeat-containing protein [Spirosoma endbachense]|uniref:Ig-like domain-containing protein n=1 Tax=Spirosoma endbachense TaxID=2666025 RepID=A0A6P1W3Y5_9BACT|nr:FG-GAP-like repeat-containing protein [Spirosoma endbachense]QHV99022.1 hypothetical protein GJR95_30225 [Spirosoma endbachense]
MSSFLPFVFPQWLAIYCRAQMFWLVYLLVGGLLIIPSRLVAQCFLPATNYGVGTEPRSVTVSDVNADGHVDIISANNTSNNVSVLLGKAEGGFASAINYPTGINPRSVVAGDVNGDGRPDLITANATSNTVSILLGDGAGGFASPVNFPVGSAPVSVAISDINADSHLDLITANYNSNTVSILLGDGAGSFATPMDYPIVDSPFSVWAADVYGDGKISIVTANGFSDNVSILPGVGDGSFRPAVNWAVGDGPSGVVVSNINGDLSPDIITANSSDNSVTVLRGQLGGVFSATSYPVGAVPFNMTVSDVNADGHLDIISANNFSDNVSVLLGNGAGSFAAAINYPVDDQPYFVVVSDLNADGRPDIITANAGSNNISVLYGSTPVVITQQPVSSSSVAAGANVRVQVGISGTTTSLQWYNQAGIVSGQTSATLTLNGVTVSQSGSYSLVATSACNSLTTNAFTLTVNNPPAAPSVITPANGGIFNDNTPECSGTAPANSTVLVYIDNVLSGTTTAGQTGNWSYSPATPLTDAPHTVHAIARLNGLDSPLSNTNSFQLDTSPPETSFSTTPPLITSSTSALFRFSNSEGGSTFQFSLDGSEYQQRSFSNQSYSGLVEGDHTFRVRAVDQAGNVDPTPATYTWTIDTTPPSVTISSSAGPSGSTITGPITLTLAFSEAVTGVETGDLSLTNATVTDLATLDNIRYTGSLTPTSPGALSVSVPSEVAQDAAGNLNNPSNTYSLNYQPGPSLSGFAPLSGTVCAGSPLTFTATVGNLTGAYSFTLTNGQDTPTTGSSSTGAFQQTLTASDSGSQSYTLTVSANGMNASATASVQVNALPVATLQNNGPLTCAQTSVTLTASGGGTYSFGGPTGPITGSGNSATVSQEGVYSVTVLSGSGCSAVASTTVTSNTAVAAPGLQASATSTSNQPVSVTATGCAGTVNWSPQGGGTGQANGTIYTFSQPGNYTLTATCSVGNCTSPQASPVSLQILPGGFAITKVTMVNCQLIDEAKGGYQVQFTPQYSGQNGNPISFSVVNEMPTTTAPAPYSLRLYNDNPVITLVANQAGNPEARFAYNWLASCQTGNDPNNPPTTNGIANQTILVGQAYQLQLTNYFSDPDGQSLTYSATGLPSGLSVNGGLISGTPSSTGVSSVQVTALDPGGLSAQTSFQLTVNPMPTSPAGFTIVGVSTVNCEVVSSGQRRVTFTPQYGGVDSSPISFSVINEMPATTNPGPYSLNLYTDNPSIILTAKQGASVASYVYNWLSICTAPTRVGAAEVGTGLQVQVLGNPVEGKSVEVEIRGVSGQSVQLNLTDLQGRVLHQQRLDEADSLERVSVPIGTGKGLLLLQVNTATEHQQVKLLKP